MKQFGESYLLNTTCVLAKYIYFVLCIRLFGKFCSQILLLHLKTLFMVFHECIVATKNICAIIFIESFT